MSRVIKTIEIEGQPVKALFDTGAFHTIKIRERALINGKIKGLDFDTSVVPVDSLCKADGHGLDAVIGAGTMRPWEITVNPKDGTLGLEGLKRREFTEY